MKIAIVGVGAMGSIYAGFFSDAGYDVHAIDTWQEHINAINNNGLTLEGTSDKRCIRGLKASSSMTDATQADLYIIATKGDGVATAARQIASVMKPDSLILTIQNGLGAADHIADHICTDNVLLGVADGFGASIKGPGHTHYNATKLIRLGEMHGGITDRLRTLEDLWKNAGFNARAFEDIHQLIWEKFICNVALSGPCALFECTIGELLAGEFSRPVALGCLKEAYDIGIKHSVDFSFDDPVAYLEKFVAAMPDAVPSLRQDFIAKRKTEIDAINAMVARLGKQVGLTSPYNETVSAYIKNKEARYR